MYIATPVKSAQLLHWSDIDLWAALAADVYVHGPWKAMISVAISLASLASARCRKQASQTSELPLPLLAGEDADAAAATAMVLRLWPLLPPPLGLEPPPPEADLFARVALRCDGCIIWRATCIYGLAKAKAGTVRPHMLKVIEAVVDPCLLRA